MDLQDFDIVKLSLASPEKIIEWSYGEITKPACNFRFNESPVAMLNRVAALGPSVRAHGEESIGLPIAVPALLVDAFTLSSVSDAV